MGVLFHLFVCAVAVLAGMPCPRLKTRNAQLDADEVLRRLGDSSFGLPSAAQLIELLRCLPDTMPRYVQRLCRTYGVDPSAQEFVIAAVWDLIVNNHPLETCAGIPLTEVDRPFLPPGFWPRTLGQEVREGRQSTPSVEDFARFRAIQQLAGESLRLVTVVTFPDATVTDYRAFVFLNQRTGRRIALVERPKHNNATYAFDADDPRWTEWATESRYVVWATSPPCLLGRYVHSKGHLTRLVALLTSATVTPVTTTS